MLLKSKPVASLWTKTTDGSAVIINGVTRAETTADNIVNQVNKLMAIGGKSVVVDTATKRVSVEEVIDNG